MYIQTVYNTLRDGTKKASTLLCESYRENGRQKRRTIANLSQMPQEAVESLRAFLEANKTGGKSFASYAQITQGKSFGTLLAFKHIASQIGLCDILGSDKNGRLALLLIIARIISQRSRLHVATFYPEHYALQEILGIDFKWNADSLYACLDWLAENQREIENKLFAKRRKLSGNAPKALYLYDVTSSCLEGGKNELAEYGCNRDKKKGKKQIVIGLLCDEFGYPVSIEVFRENTSDTQTVKAQIEKLCGRFGLKKVVLAGGKGMIKEKQIAELNAENWNYITTITKDQINTLLKNRVIDMTLFCDELMEVCVQETDENDTAAEPRITRYLLRRNEHRVLEIRANRQSKTDKITLLTDKANLYLSGHPKAKTETQLKSLNASLKNLKLHSFAEFFVDEENRTVSLKIDEDKRAETEKLDGCYVVKTDVTQDLASKETVHDRYKDLAYVESAFRTLNMGLEEIRPLFLRKESRTRGHVFICMLAYILLKKFDETTRQINQTLKEKIASIDQMQYVNYKINDLVVKKTFSAYNETQTAIYDKLKLKIPLQL